MRSLFRHNRRRKISGYLSLAPRFSGVIGQAERNRNRFNGFRAGGLPSGDLIIPHVSALLVAGLAVLDLNYAGAQAAAFEVGGGKRVQLPAAVRL